MFPYVCPEPVLAKSSFLYKNGISKMPFFAVAAPYVPMHSGAAEVRRRKRISLRQTIIFSAKRLRFATPFCNRFRLKMIVLPRQAPDKHRGNSKKRPVLLTARLYFRRSDNLLVSGEVLDYGAKNAPLKAVFISKQSFCQDRLGTNMRKNVLRKKRLVFYRPFHLSADVRSRVCLG